MTAPKQPNLTTDEKKLTAKLLEQERTRLRRKHLSNNDQTELNAMAFYHRHVTRALNKVEGRTPSTSYTESI